MINKIQKYMLTHYPTIWNMRVVPMLLLLAAIHLLFFVIAYISEDTAFQSNLDYYRSSDSMQFMYTLAILVDFIILIGWLIVYNRNNSIKALYPRKVSTIYGEWIFSFVLIALLTLLPITVERGASSKWKTTTTESEKKAALNTLNQVRLFIVHNQYDYEYNEEYQTAIAITNNDVDISKLDSTTWSNYRYANNGSTTTFESYVGPSLLYYTNYAHRHYSLLASEGKTNNYGYPSKYNEQEYKEALILEQTKSYLANNHKDSVLAIFQAYEQLLLKHNHHLEATPQEWTDFIFSTAPTFNTSSLVNDYNNERSNIHLNKLYNNYTDYQPLRSIYTAILLNYQDDDLFSKILISLYIALSLSVLVFSYRVTSRKSWLTAIISIGILIFIFSLFSIGIGILSHSGVSSYLTLCILTALTCLVAVIIKTSSNSVKGKFGDSILNIALWGIPSLIPMAHGLSSFSSQAMEFSFWISLALCIIAMYPMCIIIKKFRGLADE